jgi:translation initiation factor IF-2
MYNITVENNIAHGTVEANRDKATQGTIIKLTVHPSDGYELKSLKYNGIEITGDSFMMPAADVLVTAVFEAERETEAETHTITIAEMTNGTVMVEGGKTSAAKGETITLTVAPASGYKLVEGSLKYNDTVITDNKFDMPDANVTITAAFEKVPETPETHTITIAAMTNGSVTVTGGKTSAVKGETITLAVNPNPGFKLVAGSLKYNDNVISGNTFDMPDANVTITAAFEAEGD